ncbi:MAG: phosphopantetheine-binding protein [Nitrospinales bacterium]
MNKDTSETLSTFEYEIAQLIIDTLNLETQPNLISPDLPLFGEGLGLDSIDALELSLAISQNFGLKIRSSDGNIEEIFSSLRSLSQYIEKNRVT